MSQAVVVLYPSKDRFFIQDPVSKKKKWLTYHMYQKLKKYCKFQVHKPPKRLTKPKLGSRYVLTPYYISFNTADRNMFSYPKPSRFAVPLLPCKHNETTSANVPSSNNYRESLPPKPQIAAIRLHQAVVPKSQQVVHRMNRDMVFQRLDNGTTYHLHLEFGHYSANDIGRVFQTQVRGATGLSDFEVALNLVTGRFQFRSATSGFAIDRKHSTARRLFGLDYSSKQWISSSPTDGQHVLETNHADVSGSQMLVVSVAELQDRPVAHIPLFDLGSGGLVYFNNPDTGGRPIPNLIKPRTLSMLTCTCRDELGNVYDFNGVNATYVFEVICLELRL